MKKLLLGALVACSALSAMADLVGDGYYRVQNAYSKRYAYLLDNTGTVDMSSTTADARAIQLFLGFQKAAADPSTILYVEGKGGGKYNVDAQGADLYSFFGQYMDITKTKAIDGKTTYLVYASKSGLVRYLVDKRSDLDREDGWAAVEAGTNLGDKKNWYIEPVTASGDNYLGVAPTVTASGKYYQPYFASFPIEPYSSGMKTYVVSRVEPQYGVVIISEVTGRIPGGTPVIIECSNPLAIDNRLTVNPSSGNAGIPSNRLTGVYFDNDVSGHVNHTAYDKNSMRSLTVKDGKLMFTVGDYQYCPRNEAILQLSGAAECAVSDYQVMLEADFNEYVESLQDINPDGYYRMQNASTKRYAYIHDNKGSASDVTALQLYSDLLKASSDPASVMQMSHIDGGGVFDRNLSSQNTDTKSMFGSLSISPADVKDGVQAYYVATSAGKIGDSTASGDKGTAAVGVSGDAAQWWFNPIDNAGTNHFGVAPTLTAGGKYYQPFMAGFPVAAESAGMKFYTVTNIDPEYSVMVLTPVEGVIPAGSPVIVECTNPLAADNKLTVGATGNAADLTGNLLRAVYYDLSENNHYSQTPFNPTTMRTLGVEDGKLKFVASSNSFVPRNQAYIELQTASQKEISSYSLVSKEEYDAILADAAAALATISDGGYYRVQNVASKRYLAVEDNKGSASDLGAIRLYSDILKAQSDPAFVFKTRQNAAAAQPEWDLTSQNTQFSALAGANVHFKPMSEYEGLHTFAAYVDKDSKRLYLDDANGDAEGSLTLGNTPAEWQLKAVDEANDANFFGITPSITAKGKYYEPFMAAFPYVPYSEGVKVYVITKIDAEHKQMVRDEVEGEIPLGLPVIIECENPLAADNRLELLPSTDNVVKGNYLKGVYFNSSYDGHVNHSSYNKTSMRVLKEVDGKLMFVKSDDEYLPRNQAYVLLTTGTQMAVDSYEVLTRDEYTALNVVEIIAEDTLVDVYHLDGTLVRKGISKSEAKLLPGGVYLLRGGSATEKLLVH